MEDELERSLEELSVVEEENDCFVFKTMEE